MQQIVRALPVLAMLLLAGCSMGPSNSDIALGPTLPQPNSTLGTLGTPATITPVSAPAPGAIQSANTTMNDVTAFLDASVLGQLSAKDKSEAASAQFNALTFGRPGAPRAWTGDKGTSGNVTVGPYVRVNNIDCRDFTHTVTIAGTPHARKGTACREVDGTWSVAG
jgi:surface antigen